MKLTITRAILGLLIILAASYIAWWMMSGVNALLTNMVPNENGVIVHNVTLENGVLFTIARYLSIPLLVLGLFISIGSIWQRNDHRKVAVTHIVSGGLVFIISVFILIWGYAMNFIWVIEGGPVIEMGQARILTALTAFLGLVVSGLSITQLVKSKG